MAATAAVAVCLFNANISTTHSPTDSTHSQCLRLHSASSWTPMPIMPFTTLKALRLHTPTSSKLYCILQETTIEEAKQEDIVDPDPKQEDIVDPDPKKEGSPSSDSSTRLYVCNLPFGCDAAEVRSLFEGCGKVISAELMMDKETGRSRGFAFVTMGTVEEAHAAIKKYDEYELGGRIINVRFTNSTRLFPNRRSSDPDFDDYIESPNRIYCGNLAWTVTSRSLREFFNINGNVLGAKVMYEPQTGRSLGYGFVSFESEGDMKNAVAALNGKDLEGRPVQLRRVRKTKKPAIKKNSATEGKSTPQEIVKEEIMKE